MRVLLLDPGNTHIDVLQNLSCESEETVIVSSEDMHCPASESPHPDVIVAGGDSMGREQLADTLLAWRTHPCTYLIPCWIAAKADSFAKTCLWPRLSIDRMEEPLETQSLCSWISAIAEWQQYRMQFDKIGTLDARSALELATSLALRKATGKLLIFGQAGAEGQFAFREGCLSDARVGHLRGSEAFFEFLSWSDGLFSWEHGAPESSREEDQPLQALIEQGLDLLRNANLLYHFVPDLGQRIVRTDSESALDDGAIAHYEAKKELFSLISGELSVSELLEISSISRPATMSALARWLSMGDLEVTGKTLNEPRFEVDAGSGKNACRLLVVDDSRFMCGALKEIFSVDNRFEIVGFAHDGAEALDFIERGKPDVVTLDIQMPRMDGLTALKHIMIRDPKPVVVLSSFTSETSELTYESFKYGAVDVCTKPSRLGAGRVERDGEELRDRVARAHSVRLDAVQFIRRKKKGGKPLPAAEPRVKESSGSGKRGVVAVICGAGGFPSLLRLLLSLPESHTRDHFIISMEMSSRVIDALLPNIQKDCRARVEPLLSTTALEPGVCYLHSREDIYQFTTVGDTLGAELQEKSSTDKQPFDRFLRNMADAFAERTVALVISGTGDDGIEGMRYVRQRLGGTFVLSPEVCLKPDLPSRLLEYGYADEVKSAAEMGRILES